MRAVARILYASLLLTASCRLLGTPAAASPVMLVDGTVATSAKSQAVTAAVEAIKLGLTIKMKASDLAAAFKTNDFSGAEASLMLDMLPAGDMSCPLQDDVDGGDEDADQETTANSPPSRDDNDDDDSCASTYDQCFGSCFRPQGPFFMRRKRPAEGACKLVCGVAREACQRCAHKRARVRKIARVKRLAVTALWVVLESTVAALLMLLCSTCIPSVLWQMWALPDRRRVFEVLVKMPTARIIAIMGTFSVAYTGVASVAYYPSALLRGIWYWIDDRSMTLLCVSIVCLALQHFYNAKKLSIAEDALKALYQRLDERETASIEAALRERAMAEEETHRLLDQRRIARFHHVQLEERNNHAIIHGGDVGGVGPGHGGRRRSNSERSGGSYNDNKYSLEMVAGFFADRLPWIGRGS